MDVLGLKKSTSLKFYKKELKKAQISEPAIPKKIHSVGIIADVKLFESYDFTKNLSDNLGFSGESMEQILYCKDPKGENDHLKYPVFTENNFGLFGKLKTETLRSFADISFDLLINYCDPDNLFSNILLIRSKAGFKAGFYGENNPLYTFNVKTDSGNIAIFNEELVKYLLILRLLE